MILHALAQYYERKSSVEEGGLPQPGFERKNIPVIIEISDQGTFIQPRVTDRDSSSSEYFVPQGVKKTSGIAANLLWDNAEYALGLTLKGKPERVIKQHEAFVERIRALEEPAKSDEGIQALLCFLGNFDPSTLKENPHWEFLQSNPNISFKLQDDNCLICERQNVIDTLINNKGENSQNSVCLVTGDDDATERLHPAIKGVWGAQSSGANIVSFNLDSFTSYGKSQGLNAPVGKQASFTYTTALNHLLRKGSEQRFQVGDASTVCWSAKRHNLEADFATILGTTAIKDDPDKYTDAVKAVFKSVDRGSLAEGDDIPFYVLGLAPNASRIAIRFWLAGTVSEFSTRIKEHFDYLEIVRGQNELEYLPLFLLLVNTAVQGKADNIPPNLGGEIMRTILAGQPYPYTLFAAAIRRCKATQHVNYPRAAIIKAYLNKSYLNKFHHKEVLKVALDKENTDPAYRLGRLFATLEKIQEDAARPRVLNVTIKDSYYGSASSNPGSVFPALLKLTHHRLAELRKNNPGSNKYFQDLMGEIMADINKLPKTLLLDEQGMFAIGYYHQRQNFFTKRDTTQPGETV